MSSVGRVTYREEIPAGNRTTLIISAWPRAAFEVMRYTGYYKMPSAPKCDAHQRVPCAACKPFAEMLISRGKEAVDLGDDRREIRIIDDREIAVSLADGCEQYGVIVCAGDRPTQEEKDQAYQALGSYLRGVLAIEDSVWNATKKHVNSDHAMMACEYFNESREWNVDMRATKPCQICGNHNPIGIARCSNVACGAILDWEVARNAGILTERQEDNAIARGDLKPIKGIKPKQAEL